MAKSSKHEKKRIPIVIPIVSEASFADIDGMEETGPASANGTSAVSAYGQLVGERNRYVDARHRAQQRMDQIVTGAAAGALVLSITFLNGIAGSPSVRTAWLLIAGWSLLAVALGASLTHHHLAQRAYDDYVRELDRAFGMRDLPGPDGAAERLPLAASAAFLAGLVCLAAFAFQNLGFA
jgi:hypothetical protein